MAKKFKAEDVSSDDESWFYSDKVREHFFNPKNLFKTKEEVDAYAEEADGVGVVGNPACGDCMKMFIKVDEETDEITECKWQTFGCASAIASTSVFSEMVKGMELDKALEIESMDIVEELGGLPKNKIHCSVLANNAFKKAVEDYRES